MIYDTKITHSDYAILNIRHKFTLIQQKSWHYMLVFAAKDLDFQDEHKISLARLVNYLNVKSSYEIKDKILGMGKTESLNEFSYYFEHIKMVDDTVFYSYPEHLRLLLSHQSVIVISKKMIETSFHSKYSLFLYEFILFYTLFNAKHTVSLCDFRNYLGLEPYQYADVKGLHKTIVIQALYEINNQTLCNASLKYEKAGTVIVAVKITVSDKNKLLLLKTMSTKEKSQLFLSNAACARYYNLSHQGRKRIDLVYEQWLQASNNNADFAPALKKQFLLEQFVAPYENNPDLWQGDDMELLPAI